LCTSGFSAADKQPLGYEDDMMIKIQKKPLSVMGWTLFGLVILAFSFAAGFVQGQKYAGWEGEDAVPYAAPLGLPAPCPFLPEKDKEYIFDGWEDDMMLIRAGNELCSLKILPETILKNMLDDSLPWSDMVRGDKVYFLSFEESGELTAQQVTVIKPLLD
jgi:hypothetical protein